MSCIKSNAIPAYMEREMFHVKQRYNWDCGVACVLMVLPPTERCDFLRNFLKICEEEGFKNSTWTIDLCYLLKRFDIPHNYYTTTIGVHPGYRGNLLYYDKLLHKDELRIKHRFESAESNNLYIRCTSLSMKNLVFHLLYSGPIILLINVNLLTCDLCKVNKLSLELRSCFPWPVPYLGHYIVLCGYNSRKQKIIYRNPSYRDRLCAISLKNLDIARKSYGTDEDVILIFDDRLNFKRKIITWQ